MRLSVVLALVFLAVLVGCRAESAVDYEQRRLHAIMRECDQSENYQPLLEYLNTQYDEDVERMVNETTVRWAHAHRDQYFKLAPRLSSARLKGLSDLVERLQRERDEIRERVNANK